MKGDQLTRSVSSPPKDGVNLERASLRVESMQTYAVVSSIIMGSNISMLSLNDNIGLDDEDFDVPLIDKIAIYMLLGLQAISLVASSYTTVVFTLMALYYSTSLGLGGDECYEAFDAETKTMRMRAFYSFIASLSTLMLSFVPCAYLYVHGSKGIVMATFLAVLIMISFHDFKKVIDSAGRTIFNPLFQPNSHVSVRASMRRLSSAGNTRGLSG